MIINGQTTRNPVIISQSAEDETDKNLWKIMFLGVVTVFFSLSVVYTFHRFLVTLDEQYVWYAGLAVLGFLTFIVLQVFFVKRFLILMILLFLETIAPMFMFTKYFYSAPRWILIIGWFVFFLFSFMGAKKGMALIANSLKIKFFPVAKDVLRKSATALFIFLSILVYFNYFELKGFNDELGMKITNSFLNSSKPAISLFFDEFSFDKNGNEILAVIVEQQLKSVDLKSLNISGAGGGDITSIKNLPPLVKRDLIQGGVEQLKMAAEGAIGFLDWDKPVKEIIYGLIKGYFLRVPENLKPVLNVSTAVLVFFTLKGTAFFLYWLVEFIAFVIFKLLIILGFAYINLQSRSREFIMLS